ncbi:MAG: hypothetical protein CMP65_05065 [Flavobacteriales bacterium]|nr:hypothetical protein [Flavobacteriales bacterium]|tara:strand:- start:9320 stop:9592 length:273 start_codon:yes stop_codon:yes gene_type:complete
MKKLFSVIAFLEGISYILLLIAVPIKYIYNNEYFVQLLGMPHGILFIIYVTLSIIMKFKMNWNYRFFLFVIIASIIPFGTFYIEYKYLNH